MNELKYLMAPDAYARLEAEMAQILIDTAAVEYDAKYFTEV